MKQKISSTVLAKSDNTRLEKNNNIRLLYNNKGPGKYKDWDENNRDKNREKIICTKSEIKMMQFIKLS